MAPDTAERWRWLIEGTLTTESPLHVGDGSTTTRGDLPAEGKERDSELVEIAAVATDHEGRAYLPGTTLKGNLRAWAREAGLETRLREVFGYADATTDTTRDGGRGGAGEFWDAFALPDRPAPEHAPPYWHDRRLTGVTASVAIARDTRTASDQKLFHHEFVPPGVSFKATVAGRLTEAEVQALLALLEAAPSRHGLGARTGDGWGRLSWKLDRLARLDAPHVLAWLQKKDGKPVGYAALPDLPPEEVERWRTRAVADAKALTTGTRPRVEVSIELAFDSAFLVNDPSQTRKDKDKRRREAGAATRPDHAPARDRNGRPFLPASSFRGALRSQAERILRTLGGDAAACGDHLPGGACQPTTTLSDVSNLCPACKVFGATGWRSPLEITDFVAADDVPVERQEFLAIDRFTGGGADKLKFDALRALKPRLRGRVTIDVRALERCGAGAWALGLLGLVLRDLEEGDIRFGFGAAKGYGACRATLTYALENWTAAPEEDSGTTRDAFEQGDATALGLLVLELELALRDVPARRRA